LFQDFKKCLLKLTVEVLEVVLLGAEVVLEDEGVGAGEVGHSTGIEFTAWKKIVFQKLNSAQVYFHGTR
jgi:hypothetical protein